MTSVLEIDGLGIKIPSRNGLVSLVEGVCLDVEKGQVFGIAGESGSGKTVSMMALLGLLPSDAQVTGRAMFEGRDLMKLRSSELRQVCGRDIAMVFQDPMSSLHPMLTIGRQLTEHVRLHLGLSKAASRGRAIELLGEVRIPDPGAALYAYPHQFSGGMRQRIAIAIALACDPKILIADEPTTSLDVTVQAGIIRLLDRIRSQSGLSIVLITHDLGMMASLADSVAIFYAGRVVEYGTASQILSSPRHPYTKGLIDALPSPEADRAHPLVPIKGSPPPITARPSGCAFHPRCPYAENQCRVDIPALVATGDERMLACPVDPLRVT